MTPLGTDDREALLADLFASASRLLESGGTRERLLKLRGDEPFPDEVWRSVIAAGWGQTLIAEEHGGLGLGLPELGAIFRAVGRRFCRGPLLDQLVTLPLLLRAAPPAMGPRLLKAVDGSELLALAQAPAAPYGRGGEAVAYEGGRLNGEIDLVPFGMTATALAVVASTRGAPVIVLVDRSALGTTPLPSHDPSVQLARVTLRAVPAVDGDVIARDAPAAALLAEINATHRLMVAAELSGVAAELTDMAVGYAKVREQFGRPIGGFQAVRHIIARMAQRSSSLENLADACLADADGDPSRLVELGMTAMAYATQTARGVAEDCLQVHGGIGFTAEYPLHLYLRRTLTYQSYLGESSDLYRHLGGSALAG